MGWVGGHTTRVGAVMLIAIRYAHVQVFHVITPPWHMMLTSFH